MVTVTLNNETVKDYAKAKYPAMVSVTELVEMPAHFDLGRGSKYATVHFLGGTTERIREHVMIDDNEVFDSEAKARAFAALTPTAEIWQTLRGAVAHCPIEMQDEPVWVVTQLSSETPRKLRAAVLLDDE